METGRTGAGTSLSSLDSRMAGVKTGRTRPGKPPCSLYPPLTGVETRRGRTGTPPRSRLARLAALLGLTPFGLRCLRRRATSRARPRSESTQTRGSSAGRRRGADGSHGPAPVQTVRRDPASRRPWVSRPGARPGRLTTCDDARSRIPGDEPTPAIDEGRQPHVVDRSTSPRGGASEGAALSAPPGRRKHRSERSERGAQRALAVGERGGFREPAVRASIRSRRTSGRRARPSGSLQCGRASPVVDPPRNRRRT